jgi:hypothetical protein
LLSWYGIPCGDLFAAFRGTTIALAAWSVYHDEIFAWLVGNGLQESDLADACVMLERISTRIRATLWVRKKASDVMVRISDRTLNESDLQKLQRESPSAYDELIRAGSVRVSIPRLNSDSRIERQPQC